MIFKVFLYCTSFQTRHTVQLCINVGCRVVVILTSAQQSAVAEMGDMGRKVGAVRAPIQGVDPHLTKYLLGRGLPPYQEQT